MRFCCHHRCVHSRLVAVLALDSYTGDPKKNRTHKSLNTIFNFDYSSFLFQVVVVDLVHEILQQ